VDPHRPVGAAGTGANAMALQINGPGALMASGISRGSGGSSELVTPPSDRVAGGSATVNSGGGECGHNDVANSPLPAGRRQDAPRDRLHQRNPVQHQHPQHKLANEPLAAAKPSGHGLQSPPVHNHHEQKPNAHHGHPRLHAPQQHAPLLDISRKDVEDVKAADDASSAPSGWMRGEPLGM